MCIIFYIDNYYIPIYALILNVLIIVRSNEVQGKMKQILIFSCVFRRGV